MNQDRSTKFCDLPRRSIWEEALSTIFFFPYRHQESCYGSEFAEMLLYSELLFSDPSIYLGAVDVVLKNWRWPDDGHLQNIIRELVLTIHMYALFKQEKVDQRVIEAVKNFDQKIKCISLANHQLREETKLLLFKEIENSWGEEGTLLYPLSQKFSPCNTLCNHIISSFLITGTIQIADSIVHCLLTEESFLSTVQKYPANALVTRRGLSGETLLLFPQTTKRKWMFGQGIRKCPASKIAPKVIEKILKRVRKEMPSYYVAKHKRSLAVPIVKEKKIYFNFRYYFFFTIIWTFDKMVF